MSELDRLNPRRGVRRAGAVRVPPAVPGVSALYLVKVKKVGGAAGDLDTKCSWTYNIWPLTGDIGDDDQRLSTDDLQPLTGRPDEGKFDYAADETYGLAFQDPNDSYDWKLYALADEVPDCGPCDGAG